MNMCCNTLFNTTKHSIPGTVPPVGDCLVSEEDNEQGETHSVMCVVSSSQ